VVVNGRSGGEHVRIVDIPQVIQRTVQDGLRVDGCFVLDADGSRLGFDHDDGGRRYGVRSMVMRRGKTGNSYGV
jgi:hypothetical protein